MSQGITKFYDTPGFNLIDPTNVLIAFESTHEAFAVSQRIDFNALTLLQVW